MARAVPGSERRRAARLERWKRLDPEPSLSRIAFGPRPRAIRSARFQAQESSPSTSATSTATAAGRRQPRRRSTRKRRRDFLNRGDGNSAPDRQHLSDGPVPGRLGAFEAGGPLDLVTSAGLQAVNVATGTGRGVSRPRSPRPNRLHLRDRRGRRHRRRQAERPRRRLLVGARRPLPGEQRRDVPGGGQPPDQRADRRRRRQRQRRSHPRCRRRPVRTECRHLPGRRGRPFAAPAFYPVTGIGSNSVAVADLNHDGHLDIVTADQISGDLSVLINRGDGTFASATQIPNIHAANDVVIDDLDGDGNPDLIVAGGGGVTVLPGHGDGTFGNPILLDPGVETDFVPGRRLQRRRPARPGGRDVQRHRQRPDQCLPAAPEGSIQFSAPSYSVVEGVPSATITVTRTDGSEGAVSARYSTSAGTAQRRRYQDVSGDDPVRRGRLGPEDVHRADPRRPRVRDLSVCHRRPEALRPDRRRGPRLARSGHAGHRGRRTRTLSVNDITVAAPAGTATFSLSLDTPSAFR